MNTDSILKVIIDIIGEVMPKLKDHTLEASDGLEALGANSMDRAEIVIMTLENLGLKVPLFEMFGPRNIGELAELLHAKLQAA